MTPIDRTAWPWNAAPVDVDDYDAATWHAVRRHTDGELPVQSLRRWTLEQRVRRSRDVQPLYVMTEADHFALMDEVGSALSAVIA